MSKYISLNGEIFLSNEACLSYDNRGLLYGDCFSFELRGNSSKPFLFDEYYKYITNAFRYLSLEKSILYEKDILLNDIFLLLQKNRIYKGFKARLTFFRNKSASKIASDNTSSILISVESLADELYQINERGYSTLILPYYRLPDFAFNNIFPSFNKELLSYSFLKNNKIDDALILDDYGNIVKSLSSNVFFLKDGKIILPERVPEDSSKIFFDFIVSIVRMLNIKIVRANVKEIKIKDLDEMFFANIVDGVRWVVAYKDKRFFNQTSNRIAKELSNILH